MSLPLGWLFISFRFIFDAALIINYEINTGLHFACKGSKYLAANSKSRPERLHYSERTKDALANGRKRPYNGQLSTLEMLRPIPNVRLVPFKATELITTRKLID